MSKNGKVAAVVVACAVAVFAVGHSQGWFSGGGKRSSGNGEPDLSKDPVYGKYEFGQDGRVIDIGIQPLWIPTNMITEAMKRDGVLRDALARDGLTIRFHVFRKGADVNYFLARGDLEIGVGGDMPALSAAVRSGVVVAAVIQRGPCAIVAGHHMLTKDLKGLRIAYPYGSISHYALLRLLASAGVAHDDVRLVAMDVGPMPGALARGDIDAFAAWEPTPTIAIMQNPEAVVIHQSTSSGYLYFSRAFAQSHPGALRQIVAAQIRAMKWLRQKRANLRTASRWAISSGQALAGKKRPLAESVYADLALKDILGVTSFPEITADELARRGPLAAELQFLKEVGEVPENVKWEDLKKRFDTSIVGEIVREDKKYQLDTFRYTEVE